MPKTVSLPPLNIKRMLSYPLSFFILILPLPSPVTSRHVSPPAPLENLIPAVSQSPRDSPTSPLGDDEELDRMDGIPSPRDSSPSKNVGGGSGGHHGKHNSSRMRSSLSSTAGHRRHNSPSDAPTVPSESGTQHAPHSDPLSRRNRKSSQSLSLSLPLSLDLFLFLTPQRPPLSPRPSHLPLSPLPKVSLERIVSFPMIGVSRDCGHQGRLAVRPLFETSLEVLRVGEERKRGKREVDETAAGWGNCLRRRYCRLLGTQCNLLPLHSTPLSLPSSLTGKMKQKRWRNFLDCNIPPPFCLSFFPLSANPFPRHRARSIIKT